MTPKEFLKSKGINYEHEATEMCAYVPNAGSMNKRWKHKIDFLVNQDIKGGKWENVKIYLQE
jgi:hypothetical protein